MRHAATAASARPRRAIPRGWIILGCALGAWAFFALLATVIPALFGFIAASI